MSDLQKIVVLCFFGALLLGGVLFVAPLFISFQGSETPEPLEPIEQVDPPSLDIDAVPADPEGLPVMGNGKVIDSFKDCVRAGYPVMESYPAQCRALGMLFTQRISTATDTLPTTNVIACTTEAKICPDGSGVGRTGPDCAFAACPGDVSSSEDDDVHLCTAEEKASQICTMEYAPVCGLVEVQCVTTPCDPIAETFSNGCSACGQGNIISYTEGVCEQ